MTDVTPAAPDAAEPVPAAARPVGPQRRPPSVADATRNLPRFGARWIALLAATLIALFLCWRMAQPFIEVFLWAGVLVVVFFPVHERVLAKVRRPGLAALISSALVVVTILGPLTLVTLAIAREAVQAADNIQAGINRLLDPNSRVHQLAERWFDLSELQTGEWKRTLVQSVQEKGGTIASQTFQVFGKILGALIKILFVILTMYYFFRDGVRIKGALHDLLPLEHEQSEEIFRHTREVISASVNGVVVIAAIQAVIGTITFAILRVPSPLMWGAIMFLASMIPLGGSALVWGPVAVYLLFTGAWGRALALVIVGVVIIGTIDNLLRPKLVGDRTRLHELLVLFSVLGGLQVFGPLGLVVGPVMVAITLGLLDVFRQVQRPAAVTVQEPSVIEQQDAVRAVPPEERGFGARDDSTPSPLYSGERAGVRGSVELAQPSIPKQAPHPDPLP